MSNTPKEQTAGIGPEIKHRGFVKTNAKGFYNELRVFNDKDQLLTNWTGEVISAHCMYDDNDGYEEWNVTNTPDRDKANGYRVRNCYLALDGNAVPVAAHLNQPPTEDNQPGETVDNWIPISTPPKKNGVYLVWGSAYADTPRQALRCNYYKKVFRADSCNGVRTKNITHWMPMPNEPKS